MVKSLLRVAGTVAIATVLSKVIGMVRQLLVAQAFGSSIEYSAFTVAYILPGFVLILLGGINGPFHSAMVSILKKRGEGDPAPFIETISSIVGLILAGVTVLFVIAARPLVIAFSPGSSAAVHDLAATQLQIMAPLALLSGWIGIGFGTLNAADRYLLPAISPILSSLTIITALLLQPDNPMILAWGVLIGGIAQWAIQLPLQNHLKLGGLRWRWDWHLPEVQAVGRLMLPAVLSSGMIHINLYTDTFFASFIPGDRTIGNLGYAQLLYLTPLGILSNMILVPLMPLYSRLALPDYWPELRTWIRKGLLTTVVTILPCSMLFVTLARPLVQLVYERGAFTPLATQEVAALLMTYALGMVFYLGRDVMVRIFYALEDSRTPFVISVVSIGLNAVFDWFGIQIFGAPGLAYATAGVNVFALVVLSVVLHRKLGYWPWQAFCWDSSRIVGITLVAGAAIWGTTALTSGNVLLTLIVGGSMGMAIYGTGVWLLRLPEVESLVASFQARFFPATKS